MKIIEAMLRGLGNAFNAAVFEPPYYATYGYKRRQADTNISLDAHALTQVPPVGLIA